MSESNYKSKHVEALNKACEIMGSQAALAKALGITSSNIAQWRNLENGVPAHHCPKIEKLTGDLDYKLLRNEKTVLSETELKYCYNDVLIVTAYIKEQAKLYGKLNKIPLTNTGRVRRYVRK